MMSISLNPTTPGGSANQKGAALIMSLVILLIMTVVGVAGMQSTVMEEKMAGSLRNRSVAFQAAESALRDAENSLTVAVLPSFDGSVNGLYEATSPPIWETIDWSTASNVVAYSGGTLTDVAAAPTYIIEELEPVLGGGGSLEAGIPQQTDYYRVTARGVGGSTTAVVMLQSTYKR